MTSPDRSQDMPTRRLLLVTADGELGGGSLLVLQAARHLAAGWDVHLATTPGTWLATEAEHSGVTVHGGRFLGSRTDLRAAHDLRAVVDAVRPSVVHAHGTRSMLHTLALGVAHRRTSGPGRRPLVVHTVHGIHALHHPEPLRSAGLVACRLAGVASDCTTFVSDAELALARRHHLLSVHHDVRVIHNGTGDPSHASAPVPAHVVWVGRMVEQKDPRLAAHTARALAEQGHTVTIVGDGPLADDVHRIVAGSRARDRIRLTGRLAAQDTEAIVASADVALVTSAWEGLPLVVLEALRYGIPVVGADADGVREVLTGDTGATIVGSRNPEALATAVTDITGDREERARRSLAARRVWSEQYRLQDCLDSYGRLYDELLDRSARAAAAPGPRRLRALDGEDAVSEEPVGATTTSEPRCSVVIVNFNGGGLVVDAARSASDAAAAIGCTIEVLVVDNDSQDGSPELLEQTPGVTVIRSGSNVGFPAACNTGIDRSTGAVVLLLNPDARIDADALRLGLTVLDERSDIGLLGLGQRDAAGRTLPVTYAMPSIGAHLRRQVLARIRPDAERPEERAIGEVEGHRIVEVDGYLSGACLFARRRDLLAVDGLDPDLFWAEDADLCRRIAAKEQVVALLRDLEVQHAASSIRNRFLDLALFQQYRGYLRFVHVHDGTVRATALATLMAAEIAVKWIIATARRDEQGAMRRRAYRAVLPALAGWATGASAPRRLDDVINR